MRRTLLLAALVAPVAAFAADGTMSFEMVADPGNMTACLAMGPSFDRPFTVTVAGSNVTLTSPGGINMSMEPAGPDKYHAVFELSGERLDSVADLGAAKTLSIRGNNLGCKWMGKAQ